MSTRVRIALAYVACFVLWGSTWLVIRLGLRDLPPLTFAATRMLLAAALLSPFAIGAGLRGLPTRRWALLGAIGLLQIGVAYALTFVAQQWVPSGLTAVLFATFPVWVVFCARWLLPRHRLTGPKLLACGLGVAGIVVLQSRALQEQALSANAPLGGALILLGSMVVALANVLTRRHLADVKPLLLTFGQTVAGGALLALLAATFERGAELSWTPRVLLVLAYLAIFCTVLTYLLLFWLLPRVPMAAIGAIPLLDTTVAVALGAVVLGEPVGWHMLGGGALVLGAAAIANLVAD